MPRVQAIHVSAVKSLRLRSVAAAQIGPQGIPYDREFLLIDDRGRALTQREKGVLAQVESSFDGAVLELVMPDGEVLSAPPEPTGATASCDLWGRPVTGDVIGGPWAEALSAIAGRRVDLVQPHAAERGRDSHPVSIVSQEAVEALGAHAGQNGNFDARRFRPTLLISGGPAHVEDTWLGGKVRAGQAVLSAVRYDPRCSLTTRNPQTGERDADTLRWIDETRGRFGRDVCFGIYADVVEPGAVAVGDTVEPLAEEDA